LFVPVNANVFFSHFALERLKLGLDLFPLGAVGVLNFLELGLALSGKGGRELFLLLELLLAPAQQLLFKRHAVAVLLLLLAVGALVLLHHRQRPR